MDITLSFSLSAVGQFEKRERPKVIADGHRDAIIDCLYKNTNTGDVSDPTGNDRLHLSCSFS